jgi:heme/copper-type cytochrome/quinol oxidase subunit 2
MPFVVLAVLVVVALVLVATLYFLARYWQTQGPGRRKGKNVALEVRQ